MQKKHISKLRKKMLNKKRRLKKQQELFASKKRKRFTVTKKQNKVRKPEDDTAILGTNMDMESATAFVISEAILFDLF